MRVQPRFHVTYARVNDIQLDDIGQETDQHRESGNADREVDAGRPSSGSPVREREKNFQRRVDRKESKSIFVSIGPSGD